MGFVINYDITGILEDNKTMLCDLLSILRASYEVLTKRLSCKLPALYDYHTDTVGISNRSVYVSVKLVGFSQDFDQRDVN